MLLRARLAFPRGGGIALEPPRCWDQLRTLRPYNTRSGSYICLLRNHEERNRMVRVDLAWGRQVSLQSDRDRQHQVRSYSGYERGSEGSPNREAAQSPRSTQARPGIRQPGLYRALA